MSQRGVSLCVIGSLALAWSGWSARGVREAPRDEPAPPSALAAPATFAPAGQAAGQAAGQPAALLVRAASGEPLAGVQLWSTPRHARVLDPSTAHLLAETDPSGRVAWPTPELDPTRELVVAGPGLRSAALPTGAARGGVVRLAAAHRLRFRCRSTADTPVAGVTIALGRTLAADDVFSATPGRLPGGDPTDALHVQATGDDGVAVLEGLGAMRYAVQVAHPHFAVLHGIDTGTIDAGTSDAVDEVRLTLAPMVACVLEPPSPWPVRASTLDLMGVPTPATRSSRLAVAEAQQRLRAAHPGCFVHVMLQRAASDIVEGRGKALVGDQWAEFAVVLRPISHLRPEPLPIEAATIAAASGAAGELTLVGNGSAHASACGLHAVHQGSGLACYVPIPAAGPLRLPPGDYLLDSTDALAKVRLQRTLFSIRPGQRTEHEFRLGDARVVRVNLRTPHALPAGRTGIELRGDDQVLGHVMCLGTEACVLAPTGACELVVRAFGYAPTTVRLPAGTDPTTLDLELHHAQ